MKLIKAHALGNDFLLVAADRASGRRSIARRCARGVRPPRGIGADGLIIYTLTAEGAAMELFNADGSHSEVSGNGVRCLAAWLALDARPTSQPRSRSTRMPA